MKLLETISILALCFLSYSPLSAQKNDYKLVWKENFRGRSINEKYWSKFGEDVVYDWEEVGAMKLTRYTYNYNKKHSKLEQIDYYVEYVKPYFTEKSAADSKLELKGDVYYKTHIVADFEYSDSAIKLP